MHDMKAYNGRWCSCLIPFEILYILQYTATGWSDVKFCDVAYVYSMLYRTWQYLVFALQLPGSAHIVSLRPHNKLQHLTHKTIDSGFRLFWWCFIEGWTRLSGITCSIGTMIDTRWTISHTVLYTSGRALLHCAHGGDQIKFINKPYYTMSFRL